MKKLLSTLLAVVLAVNLLPMAAYAEKVTYNNGDEGGVPMTLTVEAPVQYTVTVSASPDEDHGTVTGGGTYEEGASVTVTATPKSDYYMFSGWLENGEKVKNAGASYTFTATADRNLVAVFEPARGLCRLMIYPSDYFNVSGEGEYYEGEMVTITAVPKHAGVEFEAWWQDGDTLFSKEASYSFNIFNGVRLEIAYKSVSAANVKPGEGSSGKAVITNSLFANRSDEGHMFYTSEGLNDLKFCFPPADYFPAPEGKVFDCWQLGDDAYYEAGSVQTVIGDGVNPDFASKNIVVTAKWKDDDSGSETDLPSCVISIPEKIDIPYMQEKTLVNWKLESLNLAGRDTLDLTFFEGTFSNSKGQTIAYTVAGEENAAGDSRALFIFKSAGGRYVTVVNIAKEEWEAAAPGKYTATLRFNAYFR